MKQKTKPKSQKRKEPEMVRKSELLRVKSLLSETERLNDSLIKQSNIREVDNRSRVSQLENNLADAYDEQQRLFTIISTLGRSIQNMERVIRNRGRNFNSLQAETTNQQIINQY